MPRQQVSIISRRRTTQRFSELIHNLKFLESLADGSSFTVDAEFTTPLAVLPLAPIIRRKNLQCSAGIDSYLSTISFPNGVIDCSGVCRGTYIPIIHLPLGNINDVDERSSKLNALHEGYLDLLRRNIISDEEFVQFITHGSFGLLIGELIDNILEHSDAQNVYVLSQYWPRNSTCEICIMDDGQGLLGSLAAVGRDVSNSADAITKIVEQCLSAKDEYGDIYRGTGLKMARKAVTCSNLSGEFLIASGDSAYFESFNSGNTLVNLSNYSLSGTMIMLKFKQPSHPLNIYEFA